MEDTEIDDGPLLTPEMVARQLGVSVDTVNAWRVAGRRQPLAFVKVGNKLARYRPSDVREFIEAHRHAA